MPFQPPARRTPLDLTGRPEAVELRAARFLEAIGELRHAWVQCLDMAHRVDARDPLLQAAVHVFFEMAALIRADASELPVIPARSPESPSPAAASE